MDEKLRNQRAAAGGLPPRIVFCCLGLLLLAAACEELLNGLKTPETLFAGVQHPSESVLIRIDGHPTGASSTPEPDLPGLEFAVVSAKRFGASPTPLVVRNRDGTVISVADDL